MMEDKVVKSNCWGLNWFLLLNFLNQFNFYFRLHQIHYHNLKKRGIKIKHGQKILKRKTTISGHPWKWAAVSVYEVSAHQDHRLLVSVQGQRLNCISFTAEKTVQNLQKESSSIFFNFKENQKKKNAWGNINVHCTCTLDWKNCVHHKAIHKTDISSEDM